MVISKCPDNAEALKISIFLLSIRRLRQTGCSPSFEDSCVLNGRESSSLLDHKQMAHVLWQQRCLEATPRLHHVGVVDETRRTYRHHGRQRDAPRRIATFRHATLRVAIHRYATLEPLGKPGGSRAFSADAPLNRLWLRDAYRSQPEAETEEI